VLEADERDPAPAHDQLARIRGADTDHEVEIDRTVGFQQLRSAAQGVLGDRDDVHVLEHAP